MDRRTLIIAAGGAVLLAACAPVSPPSPAVPTGDAYFALGTEPFWSLEITDGRLAFNDASGTRIAVPNPGPTAASDGQRYVTPRLTVDIRREPCGDGMSDRRYTDTVRLVVDGRELHGCGGTVVPPAELDGTSWRLLSIGGTPVVEGREASFAFSEGRISGTAGCNRLTGAFSSDGSRLTVSNVAGTRMMCPPDLMAQEDKVIALLRQSLAMRFDSRGRMILTGNDSVTMVLERII